MTMYDAYFDRTSFLTGGHAIVQDRTAVNEVANSTQQAMYTQPCTLGQIQAREADIRALTELARALDKKVLSVDILICVKTLHYVG